MQNLGLRSLLFLVVLVLLLPTAPSFGHGSLPISNRVLIQQNTLLVPTEYWGIFVREKDAPWRWICDEAINEYKIRDIVLGGDGTLYATDFLGLTRSTDGGCTWQSSAPMDPLATRSVLSVVPDPKGKRTVYAVVRGVGAEGGLFRSDNSGESFTQVFFAPSVEFLRVSVAKGAERIYLSGVTKVAEGIPTLYVGEGTRFVEKPIAPIPKGVTLASAVVLANDPRDGSAYIRMQGEATSVLLRQPLDGASVEVLRIQRTIQDIHFDLPRDRILVATEGGIYASKGGGPFDKLSGLSYAQCLTKDGDEGPLYACGWNFQPDQAAVAMSLDQGVTFQGIFQFNQTQGVALCPANTKVAQICPEVFTTYASQLGIDLSTRPTTEPPVSEPPMQTPGCQIQTASKPATGVGFLVPFFVLLLLRTCGFRSARCRSRTSYPVC